MPRRKSPASLRHAAMVCVGKYFDLVCYGCRDYNSTNLLVDSELYHEMAIPVDMWPASLLEDMYTVICSRRCGPQYLHALIQPQIRSIVIQPGTIHFAISYLQKRCSQLASMNLSGSTHMNPELFIPVFKHFSNLVSLNLSDNVIDDRSFNNIGLTCHRLRHLNVSRSTISDLGLQFLSRSEQNVPRCQDLVSMAVERCRVTRRGVASFIVYHPHLGQLSYEDTVGALWELQQLGCSPDTGYTFHIDQLTGEGEDRAGSVDDELRCAVTMSPLVTQVRILATKLTNAGLYSLMNCFHLTSLNIANTDLFLVDFDEGIVPVLTVCGHHLQSLILDRFKHIDISVIGMMCPKLSKLSLSHIVHFGQLLAVSEDQFIHLEELTLENQYGSCIVSNILRQLLSNCPGLVSLSLTLVDSLDDVVMAGVAATNPLHHLQTLTLDQCHSISGDCLMDILTSDNSLQSVNIWSCRFVTTKHREMFKNIIQRENYDMSLRVLPFSGFISLPRPPVEGGFDDEELFDELL